MSSADAPPGAGPSGASGPGSSPNAPDVAREISASDGAPAPAPSPRAPAAAPATAAVTEPLRVKIAWLRDHVEANRDDAKPQSAKKPEKKELPASGFHGVNQKSAGAFAVVISVKPEGNKCIATLPTAETAARMHDAAAAVLHGDSYPWFNFPDEKPHEPPTADEVCDADLKAAEAEGEKKFKRCRSCEQTLRMRRNVCYRCGAEQKAAGPPEGGGYKGVKTKSHQTYGTMYQTVFCIPRSGGRTVYCSEHFTAEEAARRYDLEATKYYPRGSGAKDGNGKPFEFNFASEAEADEMCEKARREALERRGIELDAVVPTRVKGGKRNKKDDEGFETVAGGVTFLPKAILETRSEGDGGGGGRAASKRRVSGKRGRRDENDPSPGAGKGGKRAKAGKKAKGKKAKAARGGGDRDAGAGGGGGGGGDFFSAMIWGSGGSS